MLVLKNLQHNEFLEKVNQKSGSNVLNCYQCGKCVSTCPVSGYMEITPRQVMQYIKLAEDEKLFAANSTWYCLTCSSCSARCPREIEIPRVMEAVRHLAIEANILPDSSKIKSIKKFHDIFISMIKRYGKMFELRLMAEFNLRTGQFFKDIALAPKAIGKGKLKFKSEKIKNLKGLKRLFEMNQKLESEIQNTENASKHESK